MSSTKVVRMPLTVPDQPTRPFDQRVALSAPWLSEALFRLLGRLRPSSRIRQALLSRAVGSGVAAFNRRDIDAVVLAFHSEYEHYPAREWVQSGLFDPVARGHHGYREYMADWLGTWGEYRWQPRELIDLGGQIVVLATMVGEGQGSGAPIGQTLSAVWTLKDGKVVRHDEYMSDAEALASVGLKA